MALSRFFPDYCERSGDMFAGSADSAAFVKVYLLITGFTDRWDSFQVLWHLVLDPTTPTKVLSLMGGYLVHCSKIGA